VRAPPPIPNPGSKSDLELIADQLDAVDANALGIHAQGAGQYPLGQHAVSSSVSQASAPENLATLAIAARSFLVAIINLTLLDGSGWTCSRCSERLGRRRT
jgi:hypothetical protein